MKNNSRNDPGVWYGNHKFPAPIADMCHLSGDFINQVPWQHEKIIRAGFANPIWRVNRDMRAGQIPLLLMRVSIDSISQQIVTDSTIVKQRVALCWRAISHHLFTLLFGVDQKSKQASFRSTHAFRKSVIGLQPVKAVLAFLAKEACRSFGHSRVRCRGVARINPQRSAMRRQLLHVVYNKAIMSENPACCSE